ncbi:MAG TPA: hypothetical protein VLA67_11030 [Nitrospiraceae bacterium]|nr:hypothetical protein [Nitrospiraceae bacterium]
MNPSVLANPGNISFSGNHVFVLDLAAAGGRCVEQSTGHLVFYRSDGRRFLATDPEGNPLHELEWGVDAAGDVTLLRARVRLDWGQWVGLKPAGLVNETSLNLAGKPEWKQLTADDLCTMAAQALRLPLEEVRFFYQDEDLLIKPNGKATIRQRKDAFYVLHDGDFEQARFMSCMGAMHWPAIDFLPVVELFQSLLPGTGSAVFELIRGLYDDQNEGKPTLLPLRYRGIPTYPSEAAFRLFSSFFTPQASAGNDPFTLFMNPERSHQVIWLPAAAQPVRYFNRRAGACLTVQDRLLHKVTVASDPSGLSYVGSKSRRFAPCDRSAHIVGARVILKDRNHETELAVTLPPGSLEQSSEPVAMSPVDWRSVFVQGIPPISPADAYGAVLLYPEDGSEIDECAAQPFVADYIQDISEQDREIGEALTRSRRVLIDNGDAVVATCVLFDRPRDHTVLVRYPAFAQKQAQRLWSVCAEVGRWEWLSHIRFIQAETENVRDYSQPPYDLVYQWVPYGRFDSPSELTTTVERLRQVLQPGGNAFVIGPSGLRKFLTIQEFRICWEASVENLPTFRMHRTILPKAKVKAGLTLFHVRPS